MSARNTLNSQSAAYDALSLVPDSEGNSSQPAVSSPPNSSVAQAASSDLLSVFSATSPSFLAAVASAVQQALSAQQKASFPGSSLRTSVAISGGVPAPPTHTSQLAAQASSFTASGAGFAAATLAMVTPVASGRPNNVFVPDFVSTFSTPIPSLAFPSSSAMAHATFPSSAAGASSVAQLPVLHQPFVVGPGFSPVPAKLVSQIVAGKFVELHELLPANIVMTEPEPQLLFDGCLVLTSSPKKPKRRIEDISTWLEAFSIYCLVLVSHFPNRWKDLLQYQLLILRTHRQFAGRVWLSYD